MQTCSQARNTLSIKKKITHEAIRRSIKKVIDVLLIKTFPMPDFFKLTERYCLELQLPGKFYHSVKLLCIFLLYKVSVSF